jgi:membrane-bound metal-dependent hydrolase YbcI (DUF457 family)
LIAASPFLANRPELALGIVAGSVLPDLDALIRLAGKVSFLRWHQTWSHALPVHIVLSIAWGIIASLIGWKGLEAGGGLFAGLTGHSLLDLTNTFGLAWLLPFSSRRICLAWVFFIDAVILLAMVATLAVLVPGLLRGDEVPVSYAAVFLAFLFVYILAKGMLRRRAGRLMPNAKSLAPSVLVPWRFFGTERQPLAIELFRVNALSGARAPVFKLPLLDEAFAGIIEHIPEYRIMREMSPEYHVVAATPEGSDTHLLCRDMRIRNFGTRFGDLEVWLNSHKQIVRSKFHA